MHSFCEVNCSRCIGSVFCPLQDCKYLLPSVMHQDMHKKCIVIDLDETLVHSSFKVFFLHCL